MYVHVTVCLLGKYHKYYQHSVQLNFIYKCTKFKEISSCGTRLVPLARTKKKHDEGRATKNTNNTTSFSKSELRERATAAFIKNPNGIL